MEFFHPSVLLNEVSDLFVKNENGVYVVYSEEEFLNYDVRLEYNDKLFDGWL